MGSQPLEEFGCLLAANVFSGAAMQLAPRGSPGNEMRVAFDGGRHRWEPQHHTTAEISHSSPRPGRMAPHGARGQSHGSPAYTGRRETCPNDVGLCPKGYCFHIFSLIIFAAGVIGPV